VCAFAPTVLATRMHSTQQSGVGSLSATAARAAEGLPLLLRWYNARMLLTRPRWLCRGTRTCAEAWMREPSPQGCIRSPSIQQVPTGALQKLVHRYEFLV
jgi:hypothetical protein